MGAVALDAGVVIGFFAPTDTHHRAALDAVAAVRMRGDTFVLPLTVLSEAMVGAYRSGTAEELAVGIVAVFGEPRVPDRAIALRAAKLRAGRRSLRLSDAFVVATAIVDDAAVLTCDRRLAGLDERVQVLEP